jgi:hypothetical protein
MSAASPVSVFRLVARPKIRGNGVLTTIGALDDNQRLRRGCESRPDPKSPIVDDRSRQQRETPLSSERGVGGADGT